MMTRRTTPFELRATRMKIAVKVIDRTGMVHMTVINDSRVLIQG